MIAAYNLLWIIGCLLAIPWLLVSVIVSPKRRKTVLHRFGLAIAPGLRNLKTSRSNPSPIWVHALSVGEVLSAVSLARVLKQKHPYRPVVFSASTLTGFETARRLLQNELDAVFYFPYDLIFSVRTVINRVDPGLVVIVETDIWPNFLFEMKRRSIPVVLVNARLSDRSYSRYRRFSKWISPLFQCFSVICTQSQEDARRFMDMGLSADRVAIAGNLKYDIPSDLISKQMIHHLEKMLSHTTHRQCVVAGSTHPGEEAILLEAFSRLRGKIPETYLILAPRDIQRAGEIVRLAVSSRLAAQLLTQIENTLPPILPDVVVVNTIGHLKVLYALCDVAFVGGSLIDFGGHNPLEPAAFAKPILMGPHTRDVAESCNRLLAAGGASVVHDAAELAEVVQTLLIDPERSQTMGDNAFQVLQQNQGALKKTLHTIARCIPT